MNGKRLLAEWRDYCLLTLLLLDGSLGYVQAGGREPLTAEQVAALALASREQYRTLDTLTTHIGYRTKDGEQARNTESRIVWRMAGRRSYSMIDTTNYGVNPTNPSVSETKFSQQFVTTTQWSKRLEQNQQSPRPRGIVARTPLEEIGLTVRDALWGLLGQDWTIFRDDSATCTLDEKTGHYILEAKNGRPAGTTDRTVVEVDPDKGWLPTKIATKTGDGKTVMTIENLELKQLQNGLWLPHTYTFVASGDSSYTEVYRIVEVEVNAEIPENKLDFVFPSGTLVQDRIAGLRYTVNEVAEGISDTDLLPPSTAQDDLSGDSGYVKSEDLATPNPASDESLLASAAKVKSAVDAAKPGHGGPHRQTVERLGKKSLLFTMIVAVAGVAVVGYLCWKLIRRST